MTSYPDDADGAVLAELAAQGVDMTQPLLIEFPVAAPDETSADAVDDALAKAGYDSHVEYDEGEPDEDDSNDPDDEELRMVGRGPGSTLTADRTVPRRPCMSTVTYQ